MTPYELRAQFREIGWPLGFRETDWRIMHGDYDLQLERRTDAGLIAFYVIFDGRARVKEMFVVDEMLNRYDIGGTGPQMTPIAAGRALLERFGAR